MRRGRPLGVRGAGSAGWALVLASACQPDPGALPSLDALRQPTGLAVAPDRPLLLVTNGNWDREQTDSTLMAVDLETLYVELARPGEPGDGSRPCRRVAAGDPTIECDPAAFIDPRTTVRLGTGAGNVAMDRPAGTDGPLRLLVPTRSPASVTWVDVLPGDEHPILECGQGEDGRCGADHEIRASVSDRLPGEPARVIVDDQGARFAYVPHILGGAFSLLNLDGPRGPELADVEGGFFREAPFEDEDPAGGFGAAVRACDPDLPSQESRECTRPFLYASQRYFPGVRALTVAPGLDLVLPGRELSLTAFDPKVVEGRPFMGDLAFEDPAVGDRLLVVQTTPAALLRLDTRLGPDARPVDALLDTEPLCDQPNVLAIHRPPGDEALALVTCAGEGRLAVVALGSFRQVASVAVGEGAFEVVVDAARQQAYVSNPREDTISIVSLEHGSPRRFTEWARLGLGAGSRTID
ncbi:YncE family protein [Paraliomyxa miuraensis]|uniref:YncE family protein n=1 Tax=Paraliomyxa miuraensis TaxID=376150 RepID=UPI00224F86F7|nr:hypothetical protein [Paraliomyxa miuraensis]MCX4241308.1 hypothetical protein [Paraliomyxa miuraensis]